MNNIMLMQRQYKKHIVVCLSLQIYDHTLQLLQCLTSLYPCTYQGSITVQPTYMSPMFMCVIQMQGSQTQIQYLRPHCVMKPWYHTTCFPAAHLAIISTSRWPISQGAFFIKSIIKLIRKSCLTLPYHYASNIPISGQQPSRFLLPSLPSYSKRKVIVLSLHALSTPVWYHHRLATKQAINGMKIQVTTVKKNSENNL